MRRLARSEHAPIRLCRRRHLCQSGFITVISATRHHPSYHHQALHTSRGRCPSSTRRGRRCSPPTTSGATSRGRGCTTGEARTTSRGRRATRTASSTPPPTPYAGRHRARTDIRALRRVALSSRPRAAGTGRRPVHVPRRDQPPGARLDAPPLHRAGGRRRVALLLPRHAPLGADAPARRQGGAAPPPRRWLRCAVATPLREPIGARRLSLIWGNRLICPLFFAPRWWCSVTSTCQVCSSGHKSQVASRSPPTIA